MTCQTILCLPVIYCNLSLYAAVTFSSVLCRLLLGAALTDKCTLMFQETVIHGTN